jgi:hypothetical protein
MAPASPLLSAGGKRCSLLVLIPAGPWPRPGLVVAVVVVVVVVAVAVVVVYEDLPSVTKFDRCKK